MDAKPLSVGKILSERQRFVVPIYQRTYAWTKRELEPLFEQIRGKSDELLQSGKVAFSQLAEAGCPLHSGWVGHLPITAWPHRAIYPTRVTSLHAALFEGMGRGRCAGSIDRGGISWYTLASRVTVQPLLWTSKW